jgi:hypothetical protein
MVMCYLVIWYIILCLDGWVLVLQSNVLPPSAKSKEGSTLHSRFHSYENLYCVVILVG